MRILVKWPTRGCPGGFADRLKRWYFTASCLHRITWVFSVDSDDPESIAAVKSARIGIGDSGMTTVGDDPTGQFVIVISPPGGKIAACNAGIPDPSLWDIVILVSDDFTPEVHGWDDVLVRGMKWNFPALDGFLHFPDGNSAYDRFPTIPVLGTNLYRRWGHIYHPSYKSLFCDSEQGEVACSMKKSIYIDLPVFQHRWRGHYAPDQTLQTNQALWNADESNYKARKAASFSLRIPVWSILICALDSRRVQGERLFEEIYRQIFALPVPGKVELHVFLDQKRHTVGAKRNNLLDRARGKFVSYIDDDDRIAPDYVQSLLSVMEEQSNADCVVFRGLLSINNVESLPFDYDLKYRFYRTTPELYERTPNHLCPIRSELARKVKFPDRNRSEDTDYAQRIKPYLVNQAVCMNPDGTKKTLYYYDYSPERTETQKTGMK